MQRHGHHDAGSAAVAAEGIEKGKPGIVISAVIMTRPMKVWARIMASTPARG